MALVRVQILLKSRDKTERTGIVTCIAQYLQNCSCLPEVLAERQGKIWQEQLEWGFLLEVSLGRIAR